MTNKLIPLKKAKKIAEKELKPEKIDWEYCIPDCGKCCRATTFYPPKYGIKDSIDEWKDSIRNARCLFLYGPSLCLIYKDRPKVCRGFDCPKGCAKINDYIKVIEKQDYDIRKKLKEMWLSEYKKKDYTRGKWLDKAEATLVALLTLLEEMKLKEKGLSTDQIDKIAQNAVERFLKQVKQINRNIVGKDAFIGILGDYELYSRIKSICEELLEKGGIKV